MPTRRKTSPANAHTDALNQLKADHRRVKKAYRDFQQLDPKVRGEAGAAIVEQVLNELTVHAMLEETLLYPAARRVLAETPLIDEAEVELETVHAPTDQLRDMQAGDDKYAARFIVLCEYVLHHVKEEKGEMFAHPQRAPLDRDGIAREMARLRHVLMPAELEAADDAEAARHGVGTRSRNPHPAGSHRTGLARHS